MFEEYDWKQRGCKRTGRKRKVPAFKQKAAEEQTEQQVFTHIYKISLICNNLGDFNYISLTFWF